VAATIQDPPAFGIPLDKGEKQGGFMYRKKKLEWIRILALAP
jgi:hypothetical protein